MPEPVDLAYAFGLEPRRAVEYFRAKGYRLAFSWEAMEAEAHARAFTVAKAMRLDVLATIRSELDRALAEGATLADFQRALRPRLEALGWWGKQVMERPDGTAQLVQTGSPRRLETIYRTNLQSAYMAGRYRDFYDNREARPFWMYVAVMDSRTRPAHAALHGKVFRFDDPIWKSVWPPNGYNCRCRVRALSPRDMERKGLYLSESGEDLTTFQETDPRTGEVRDRVSYKGPGMGRAFSPDRGFAANQALAAGHPEVAIARKALVLEEAGAMAAALHEVQREGWASWVAWVDEALAAGVVRGQSRVAGYAMPPELAFAEGAGARWATGAIEVEDRLIVGRKAARYAGQDVELGADEWRRLPLLLEARAAVYWDAEHESFVYVIPGVAADEVIRVAVRPGLMGRRREAHDSIRSAQRVSRSTLEGFVRSGRYRPVDGAL